jgi:hypothetical protein
MMVKSASEKNILKFKGAELPANLPGQFGLSGQIFLHWAAAIQKAIV